MAKTGRWPTKIEYYLNDSILKNIVALGGTHIHSKKEMNNSVLFFRILIPYWLGQEIQKMKLDEIILLT